MVVTALCVIGFTTGVAVSPALADQWDKKTILTVEQPIQVTDTVLQPGQYVLKLNNSNANRHIVQVFNGDQSRIIDTVIAILNYRLQAPVIAGSCSGKYLLERRRRCAPGFIPAITMAKNFDTPSRWQC